MSAPPILVHDPKKDRPTIVGSTETIDQPFPIYLQGWVEAGFGRGSADLGCPTANLPDSEIEKYATILKEGVYFGFARVYPREGDERRKLASGEEVVLPMVMSIGWNPFYKNTKRTAEVHVLHPFAGDFYGKELRVVILGYIRPQLDYAGMDALIKDINTDKQVSLNSVDRPVYLAFKNDEFFSRASNLGPIDLRVLERQVKPVDAEEKL